MRVRIILSGRVIATVNATSLEAAKRGYCARNDIGGDDARLVRVEESPA